MSATPSQKIKEEKLRKIVRDEIRKKEDLENMINDILKIVIDQTLQDIDRIKEEEEEGKKHDLALRLSQELQIFLMYEKSRMQTEDGTLREKIKNLREKIPEAVDFLCEQVDNIVKGEELKGFSYYQRTSLAGREGYPDTVVPIGNCAVLETLLSIKELPELSSRIKRMNKVDEAARKIKELLTNLVEEARFKFVSHCIFFQNGKPVIPKGGDPWSTSVVISMLHYYSSVYRENNSITKYIRSLEKMLNLIFENPDDYNLYDIEKDSLLWKRDASLIPLISVALIISREIDYIDDKITAISWLRTALQRIIDKIDSLILHPNPEEFTVEKISRYYFSREEMEPKHEDFEIESLPFITSFLLELHKKREKEPIKGLLRDLPEGFYPVLGTSIRILKYIHEIRQKKGYKLFGYKVNLKAEDMGITRLIFELLLEYYKNFEKIEWAFLGNPVDILSKMASQKYIRILNIDIDFPPKGKEGEEEERIENLSERLEKQKRLENEVRNYIESRKMDEIKKAVAESKKAEKCRISASFELLREHDGFIEAAKGKDTYTDNYSSFPVAKSLLLRSKRGRKDPSDIERVLKEIEKEEGEYHCFPGLLGNLLVDAKDILRRISKNIGYEMIIVRLNIPDNLQDVHWESLELELEEKRREAIGLLFPIGRTIKELIVGGRKMDYAPDYVLDVLLIGDPEGNLESAKNEIESLEKKFKDLKEKGIRIAIKKLLRGEASIENIRRELENRSWDIVHFAGHSSEGGVGWRLSGVSRSLREIFGGVRIPRFIFANACTSAPGKALSYGELCTQARAILELGVSAYVGTIEAVEDDLASEFAEEFYEHLIGEGDSIGVAMLNARRKLYREGKSGWKSYVLYGDPRIRIIY